MRQLQLDILSASLVRLQVQGEGALGVDSTSPQQIHELGLKTAPLYSLQQPFAPDEGWNIWTNPHGQ